MQNNDDFLRGKRETGVTLLIMIRERKKNVKKKQT
jgi:hypothetical protein